MKISVHIVSYVHSFTINTQEFIANSLGEYQTLV